MFGWILKLKMDQKFLLIIVMTIGFGHCFFLKSGRDKDVENLSDYIMETYSHYFTSHTDSDDRFRRAFYERVKNNLQDSENQKDHTEDFVGNIPIEGIASAIKKLVLSNLSEDKTGTGTSQNMGVPNWSWLTNNSKYDESFKTNILDFVNFLKIFVNCLRTSLPSNIEEKLFDKLSKCNCINENEKSMEESKKLYVEVTPSEYSGDDLDIEDSKDDKIAIISDQVEEDMKDGELLARETRETPVDSFDYVDN